MLCDVWRTFNTLSNRCFSFIVLILYSVWFKAFFFLIPSNRRSFNKRDNLSWVLAQKCGLEVEPQGLISHKLFTVPGPNVFVYFFFPREFGKWSEFGFLNISANLSQNNSARDWKPPKNTSYLKHPKHINIINLNHINPYICFGQGLKAAVLVFYMVHVQHEQCDLWWYQL